MFFHNGIVLAATAQNATMYFRMQGLHASSIISGKPV